MWRRKLSDDLWFSDTVKKWLNNCLSVEREILPWADVTEWIDEAWLTSNHFGPPSVNVRALIRTIAEAASPPQQASNKQRWLALAKDYGYPIPPDLAEAVAKYGQQSAPTISDEPEKTAHATDAEIDSWIREQDTATERRVGKLLLWKLAQKTGLRATKQKLEERAKLAVREYPLRVGRLKKSAPKTGPKI
jgi:hypothetical protein